jgi:hypothetical protein
MYIDCCHKSGKTYVDVKTEEMILSQAEDGTYQVAGHPSTVPGFFGEWLSDIWAGRNIT